MSIEVWAYWFVIALLVVAALAWHPVRLRWVRRRVQHARRAFRFQRERLEAKFVHLAAADEHAPAGAWEHCDFDNRVAFVRNRANGQLAAFVAISVGVDTYDLSSPGQSATSVNRRAGTAVFRYDGKRWETDGRALFNLSPFEAIRFYRDDLEVVGQE